MKLNIFRMVFLWMLVLCADLVLSQKSGDNNNMVRFNSDGSYLHYNFNTFGQKYPQMLIEVEIEKFSFKFITDERDGLIWMDDRITEQMYIGIMGGDIVFVFDDHVRPASISRLHSTDVTDFVWHSFEIRRDNRNMKFFVDGRFITEVNMHKTIQLITNSSVYIGGAPNMTSLTGRRINSSFKGALYLVKYVKTVSARIITVSLLNNIATGAYRHGDISILKYGQNLTSSHTSSGSEYIIDVIALRSASVHIPGWLDLRRGGSFGFRFRTFDSDAIIFFSERMMDIMFSIFISMELVDGRLYFVYKLDNEVKRVEVPGSGMGNGNWHDVTLDFHQGGVIVHLDQQDKTVQFTSSEQKQLMFNRGIYIAGLPPQRDFPEFLWSKRGYNGCFSKLRIDNNTTSIRGPVSVQDQTGLSTTCQMSPHCTTNPCIRGTCHEGMDRYVCNCDGSGYQGPTCDSVSPIGQFRGDTFVTFRYSSPYVSSTNDFSLRFYTILSNAFLFQTEANKRSEYIRAEIKDGRLKITVFTGINTKEFYAGSGLNDLSWHTLYLRRRGRKIELWVDNQQHVIGYLDSDYPSFTIDNIHIGNYRRNENVQGFVPYSGYLQSVKIGGVYVFDILRSRSDVTINWLSNMTSSSILHLPIFNPITVLLEESYLRMSIPTSTQRFHVMFKLRSDRRTGAVMLCQSNTGMFLYIELVLGHVLVGLIGTNRNYSRRVPQRVDSNSGWHDVEVRELDTAVGQSKYLIRVDEATINISTYYTPAFNVTRLYLGGAPAGLLKETSAVGKAMQSQIGFVGCLSSLYVNGRTPDLTGLTTSPSILTGTCDTNRPVPTPDTVTQQTLQFSGGRGYVIYHLSQLATFYPSIVQQTTNNESFAVRFRTLRRDGLIWMERRDGQTLYLAMKGGNLVFGIDSGTGSPQLLNLGSQRNLADGAWHNFKLMKVGRNLKFYIDDRLTKETIYRNTIQLASTGEVFVGGSPDTASYTRGQVSSGFDGQLTGVKYQKGTSETLMNLASNIRRHSYSISGQVTVSDDPDGTLGPSVSTTPTPSGQSVMLLEQATFRSSAWKIGNYIDLTSNGVLQFSFRTFDRRGLIWFAERLNSDIFLGVELFDGKVYLFFNFGKGKRRRQISTGTVSNGQANFVRLAVLDDVLIASVGSNTVKERLDPRTQTQRNFNGGQFISGLPSYSPYIWSGEGFNGCLMQLVVTATVTELSGIASLPSDDSTISAGCVTRDPCGGNPCNRGTCYSNLDEFECDCTATGYTGLTCSELAVVGGFAGNRGAIYRKQVSQKSYTNDIAVRFKTLFPRAMLFQTYSNTSDDYIKGELVDGSVRITVYRDGITDTHSTGSHLNDNTWHNLHVQRRDERLEVWVDQRPHISGTLSGDDFYIDISGIHLGSGTGSGTGINVGGQLPSFIGYMQNVYFDDIDIIGRLHSVPNSGITWFNATPTEAYDPLLYDPVTLSSRATYLELGTLPVSTSLHIKFKFRTGQENGLLLFNEGRNGEFIALELVQRNVVFACNTGRNNTEIVLKKSVNDNQWHSFEVKGTMRNNRRLYQVRVDENMHSILILTELEPTRPLFLGGLPLNMFVTNNIVKSVLRSDSGFIGCLASVYINTGKPTLDMYARDKSVILGSCKEITGFCPPVDPCQHGGACRIGVTRYQCDCDETGYSGPHCGLYPPGIYFGEREQPGVISYTLKQSVTSTQDSIVFGFMTKRADGTLVRLESSSGREYIVIRMAGGNLVADYNTGTGTKTLTLEDKRLNDGKYHVVHFYRDESGARLTVDGVITTIDGSASSFDNLKYVFLGGRPSSDGGISNEFYGLMGGFYYNRMGLIDQYLASNNTVGFTVTGDISSIRDHHYELVPPGGNGGYIYIPSDIGGGGVVGRSYPGGKEINIGDGVLPSMDGGGALLPETLPITAENFVGAPVSIPIVMTKAGPRAGALIGTILGTLAFAASMLWALWQCKPGILPCCGNGGYFDLAKIGFDGGNVATGGGAGGGGGGASASISGAKVAGDGITGGESTVETAQQQMSSLFMAKSISGCAEEDGYAASSDGAKVTIVNNEANQNAGGSAYYSASGDSKYTVSGGQSLHSSASQSTENSTMKSSKVFYSSTSGVTVVNDRYQQEASNFNEESTWDTSTMRSTTCLIDSGTMKSTTSLVDTGESSSFSHSVSATNINSNSIGGGGGAFLSSSSTEGLVDSANADYDFPMGYNETCSNYIASNTSKQEGFTSTINTYQVGTGSQLGQVSYSPLAVTPGAAGEEVRVDCCFVTADGSCVVTGSSSGPPQVWNMQTGELLRIMKGDTAGSSNLNLACYDSLLVGTVQADLDVNAFSIGKGVTHKNLQLWNFVTGRPLEMCPSDTCSAICLTDNKESVVFAKSDKFGNGTTITVWDLMGNQKQKEVRYDAPVGNNDYVNFLALSNNDKYCVAGFTNTFDNQMEYLTFDMSTASGMIQNPNILKLDAFSDCTVLLLRDEALTGLRDGSLRIWSLRTGQTRRNLLAGSESHGHANAVTALALSQDQKFLVSASADKTLKIWDMDREQLTRTLTGHTDEVWCTAISQDGEIVVSGSRDGSIRLWRLEDGSEICAFSTGIDVFYVTMSHDRGTIVALGDKYSARKLIMLQVVHTKIRKAVVS